MRQMQVQGYSLAIEKVSAVIKWLDMGDLTTLALL